MQTVVCNVHRPSLVVWHGQRCSPACFLSDAMTHVPFLLLAEEQYGAVLAEKGFARVDVGQATRGGPSIQRRAPYGKFAAGFGDNEDHLPAVWRNAVVPHQKIGKQT